MDSSFGLWSEGTWLLPLQVSKVRQIDEKCKLLGVQRIQTRLGLLTPCAKQTSPYLQALGLTDIKTASSQRHSLSFFIRLLASWHFVPTFGGGGGISFQAASCWTMLWWGAYIQLFGSKGLNSFCEVRGIMPHPDVWTIRYGFKELHISKVQRCWERSVAQYEG